MTFNIASHGCSRELFHVQATPLQDGRNRVKISFERPLTKGEKTLSELHADENGFTITLEEPRECKCGPDKDCKSDLR